MSPRFTIRAPSDAEVPICYALVPEIFVPVAGTWRLFLQTRADGRVITVPFTLEVK